MAPCDSVVDLPIGFKFHPKDDELLGYYLLNKVRGTMVKYGNIVPELDLYGSTEPWDIWKDYGGQRLEKGEDLYFFTKLKRANGKGSRVARTVGQGTWKGQNSGIDIKDPNNKDRLLGSWKRFQYENDQSVESGGWIMHEYSLDPSSLKPKSKPPTSDHHEYMLCRIRKNDKKRKVSAEDHDHDDTTEQSHINKIQRHENGDELLGANYTPMSEFNYQHQQQTTTSSTGVDAAAYMPIDQPPYFVSNNSTNTVLCSQYLQEFVTADRDDFVSDPASLPQQYYVELNDIHQLTEGYSHNLSEFQDGDGHAFMKNFSFWDNGARVDDENNATIQSLTAQPLGSQPYPSTQQSSVHEKRTCDETHTQGLGHELENIDIALTDNNMGVGATEDHAGGQFVTDQNAEVNVPNFPFDDYVLDVLKHGSFDDLLNLTKFDGDDGNVKHSHYVL